MNLVIELGESVYIDKQLYYKRMQISLHKLSTICNIVCGSVSFSNIVSSKLISASKPGMY